MRRLWEHALPERTMQTVRTGSSLVHFIEQFIYSLVTAMLGKRILDTNPQLFFHLQQQRLIELIRAGKVEEALEFAQEELAPRGEENVCTLLSFVYVLT